MTRLMLLAAALLVIFGAPAAAAPQILGLVATDEPIPLQCSDGECSAVLSAFCLQEQRLPPDLDTAYAPAPGTAVTLIVSMRDGTSQRLDAAAVARFETRRGFTAMRVGVPRTALPEDAVAVAVEVASRAAALPVAIAGDPDPLGADEIALATGPWRIAAETVFESDSDAARTARLTTRLVNALPARGGIAADAREAVWQRVAATDAPALARHGFEACGRTVDQSRGYALRQCLAERHRQLQIDNTHAYWNTLAGS